MTDTTTTREQTDSSPTDAPRSSRTPWTPTTDGRGRWTAHTARRSAASSAPHPPSDPVSAHIEWLAARETSVQVFTPGED